MTLLQQHLRGGGTVQDLADKFAIKATRHSKYPNLVLFKYNQIDSPFAEPLVRECRGIILDESDDWRIVSRPFDKFFNHGEGHAADIDWSTAKVQEKVDGSLATVYAYDGAWHIATSGTPDASGNVNGFDFNFAELFWKTFAEMDAILPEATGRACYMFELTSQYNRIVVRHPKPGLTILGGRCLLTQKELTTEEVSKTLPTIPVVKEFPLTSFDEIVSTFPTLDPLSQEGYIVVDENFNRRKVKSPAYVALHHMAGGSASPKSLLQIVLNGEIDEIGVAYPEYLDRMNEAKAKIFDVVVELEDTYEKIKGIEIQKEFALEACKTRCPPALFCLRSGKVTSVRKHIQNMHIDSVMGLLGYK